MTAEAALRRKGLDYERVAFTPGPHVEEMQRIYGEGRHTVPGLLVDGEPVHGSAAILRRLEPRPARSRAAGCRRAEPPVSRPAAEGGRRSA